MTLAGAAQYLKNGITDSMRRDMELLDRLQKIRAELVEVREQLKDVPDGYTVVEVSQTEIEEEVAMEAAPEVVEEIVEEVVPTQEEAAPTQEEVVVEPIEDEEDEEVEIEELVELIVEEEEEPIEESTEEQTEEPSEEPTDNTPRPRGAKGSRRSKKQEAKLFEVKPEKQRPIAPFFDQTLF